MIIYLACKVQNNLLKANKAFVIISIKCFNYTNIFSKKSVYYY